MTRRYYASRKRPGSLTVDQLYFKIQSAYHLFVGKDYFKQKAGIRSSGMGEGIWHEAALELTFQPFPIDNWLPKDVTDEHVFEVLEFLYDRVSKPGIWSAMIDERGYSYNDYDNYDEKSGRADFREKVNVFLADYPPGYELTEEGEIVELGRHGLRHILSAEIVPYDELHVDSKVRNAISKWRHRHSSPQDKKEAIRDLADVFEWLKKTKKLETVLANKDESALFDIANNFAIRHHNPGQKANYDQNIWFSWIFHFYLATYHAAVRLLIKNEKGTAPAPASNTRA